MNLHTVSGAKDRFSEVENLILTRTARYGHCVSVTRAASYTNLIKSGEFEGIQKDKILAHNVRKGYFTTLSTIPC
jgi:hypothetical protein